MRGAIAVLTGDGERAVADLSDPELQDSAELDSLARGGGGADRRLAGGAIGHSRTPAS